MSPAEIGGWFIVLGLYLMYLDICLTEHYVDLAWFDQYCDHHGRLNPFLRPPCPCGRQFSDHCEITEHPFHRLAPGEKS